jgi:PhoPQ-activated pathogenicity-related protein
MILKCIIALVTIFFVPVASGTALDDYIAKPDSHFVYEKINSLKGVGWDGHVFNMTSQQWLNDSIVSRSIWWHHVVLIIPHHLKYQDKSILFIGGGHNTDDIPNHKNEQVLLGSDLALKTNSIVTILYQVPNQPIIFYNDPQRKPRSEDDAIAATWSTFLENPSESKEWPMRLPMTKSVIRCMDMVESVFPAVPNHQFIIMGASKRGWTTYTTAATDKRVIGAVPIVMDMLNMLPSIHHMYKSYGGWTFAFKDYWNFNILEKIDTPEMLLLAEIEDPYSYIDRYTMPKLVVNAGNDEFFMMDNTYFWWDKLPEPKNRLVVQNADHSMATGFEEALPSIAVWVTQIFDQVELPQLSWTIDWDKSFISAKSSVQPKKVLLWYTTTCDTQRRDFRILNLNNPCQCGISYQDYCTNLKVLYRYKEIQYPYEYAETNTQKWTAFFMEFQYENGLILTTEACITPNIFPFADCSGKQCQGKLV